jgi:hypothetical protein
VEHLNERDMQSSNTHLRTLKRSLEAVGVAAESSAVDC